MSANEPAWLAVLREAARPPNGASVAKRLGYSAGVVSGVLKGNYTGSLAAVQAAVERELMQGRVECPVLGEIAVSDCFGNQRMPFAATSPQRVALYGSCRNCIHNPAGTAGKEPA